MNLTVSSSFLFLFFAYSYMCITGSSCLCLLFCYLVERSRRGYDRMIVGFTTTVPMQFVPITTVIVSSNLNQGEVYNIM